MKEKGHIVQWGPIGPYKGLTWCGITYGEGSGLELHEERSSAMCEKCLRALDETVERDKKYGRINRQERRRDA